jgi:hypothetical protein
MRRFISSDWNVFGQGGSINNFKKFIAGSDGKLLARENYELVVIPVGLNNRYGVGMHEVFQYLNSFWGEGLMYRILNGMASDKDYFSAVESLLAAQILFIEPCQNGVEL